jgi:hypothetical protein
MTNFLPARFLPRKCEHPKCSEKLNGDDLFFGAIGFPIGRPLLLLESIA